MIPVNVKMSECVGKYATLDREIICKGSHGFSKGLAKGSRVRITGYSRALNIATDKCPCCGEITVIRGVTKNDLTLIEGE